jgi:hypothetical protein
MPLSRSGSVNSLGVGRAVRGPESELVVDQRGMEGDDQDRPMYDDAFVTIRRKSTRRKPTAIKASPGLPAYSSLDISSTTRTIDKPLPPIQREIKGSTQDRGDLQPRGQVVSSYTDMTSEVSDRIP